MTPIANVDEAPTGADPEFDHVWHWRTKLPERKGQHCRVLEHVTRNTVLVEFEDGFTVVASHYAVRRLSETPLFERG